MQQQKTNFDVRLDNKVSQQEAFDELSDRILNFCTIVNSNPTLKFQRKSQNHVCLMEPFMDSISTRDCGNPCNHHESSHSPLCSFVIDMYMSRNNHKGTDNCVKNDATYISDSFTIQMKCYCHYKKAKGKVTTLVNQVRKK